MSPVGGTASGVGSATAGVGSATAGVAGKAQSKALLCKGMRLIRPRPGRLAPPPQLVVVPSWAMVRWHMELVQGCPRLVVKVGRIFSCFCFCCCFIYFLVFVIYIFFWLYPFMVVLFFLLVSVAGVLSLFRVFVYFCGCIFYGCIFFRLHLFYGCCIFLWLYQCLYPFLVAVSFSGCGIFSGCIFFWLLYLSSGCIFFWLVLHVFYFIVFVVFLGGGSGVCIFFLFLSYLFYGCCVCTLKEVPLLLLSGFGFVQTWEAWRDEERLMSLENHISPCKASLGAFPFATRFSSADVVLCSLERLADVGGGASTADVRLARSIRWSQVVSPAFFYFLFFL